MPVRPKALTKRRNRREKGKAKRFALHANAINEEQKYLEKQKMIFQFWTSWCLIYECIINTYSSALWNIIYRHNKKGKIYKLFINPVALRLDLVYFATRVTDTNDTSACETQAVLSRHECYTNETSVTRVKKIWFR